MCRIEGILKEGKGGNLGKGKERKAEGRSQGRFTKGDYRREWEQECEGKGRKGSIKGDYIKNG